MKTSSLILLFLAFSLLCSAQDTEVDNLKKELAEVTARANVAETAARRAMDEAKKYQMEAERSRMRAERAEAAAVRLRYIAQGKLMSIKSLDLGADPEQEALVALLAYKFNTQYGIEPKDADIYKGLSTALARFNDPLSKSQDMPAMAAALCKHVKRELTQDEWTNFAGSDLRQEKVCGE